MAFSFTGVAYLLLFSALGFLTYRFFQYWKKNKDTTSKLFLYLTISLTLYAFIRTVTGLFFADNIQIFNNTAIFVAFLEGLAAAIVAYLIIYLKFPKISPWLGFSPIFFLGLIIAILTATIPYQPSITSTGAIDWGIPSLDIVPLFSIIRLGIILVTFIPLIVILLQQFKTSDDSFIKKRSFGLSLVLSIGVIVGFIDFILTGLLKLDVIYRDIVIGILSILLFVIIFITQKPTPSKIP